MSFFKSVKGPKRMPDAIFQQIERKILLGHIKPDFMLPPETELMKQFGVSRNTVREALRMLEAAGMIRVKQGTQGGSVVTRLTNEFVSDFLIKAIRMGEVSGDSISEFKLAIEPSIAEIVARKEDIDPALLFQMEKNVLEVKELHEADQKIRYKNKDFHLLLAMATANPMFIIILKTLRASFNFATPVFIRKKILNDTIKYHQRILEAIKNRDPVNARESMQKHLLQLREVSKEMELKCITSRLGKERYSDFWKFEKAIE